MAGPASVHHEVLPMDELMSSESSRDSLGIGKCLSVFLCKKKFLKPSCAAERHMTVFENFFLTMKMQYNTCFLFRQIKYNVYSHALSDHHRCINVSTGLCIFDGDTGHCALRFFVTDVV